MEETLAGDRLGDLIAVMAEVVKDPDLMKKYFSKSYDPNSPTKLSSSSNSPYGTIMNVQSNYFPQATAVIKNIFIDAQVSAILPQAMTQPGTVTFQLPGELEKESQAKKGITKLMLLHISGTINYKMLSVTNITLATPSSVMDLVLSQPRATRSTSLLDLFWRTLELIKESDHLSIQSKYVSIKMIGKTTAGHLLQDNFATDIVTSLNNKANSINISAFLPQWKLCMVEQERLKDMIFKNQE